MENVQQEKVIMSRKEPAVEKVDELAVDRPELTSLRYKAGENTVSEEKQPENNRGVQPTRIMHLCTESEIEVIEEKRKLTNGATIDIVSTLDQYHKTTENTVSEEKQPENNRGVQPTRIMHLCTESEIEVIEEHKKLTNGATIDVVSTLDQYHKRTENTVSKGDYQEPAVEKVNELVVDRPELTSRERTLFTKSSRRRGNCFKRKSASNNKRNSNN